MVAIAPHAWINSIIFPIGIPALIAGIIPILKFILNYSLFSPLGIAIVRILANTSAKDYAVMELETPKTSLVKAKIMFLQYTEHGFYNWSYYKSQGYSNWFKGGSNRLFDNARSNIERSCWKVMTDTISSKIFASLFITSPTIGIHCVPSAIKVSGLIYFHHGYLKKSLYSSFSKDLL